MFDIIILSIILISAFFAFFRGISLEILSISGWVIAFLGSYIYGNNLVNFINKLINNIFISNIVSYAIFFLVIFILFSFITRKFSNYIKDSYVGLLDTKKSWFYFWNIKGICISWFMFFYF